MPLSLDTILAQAANSGSFNAASGTASLGSGTTAGNTVLIVATTRAGSMNTPSGFVAADTPATQLSNTKVYVFRRSGVPASETSWTISPSSSALVCWVALELQDLDADLPFDVGLSLTVNTTSGTSVSSGTTPRSTTYDGLVLAVHAAWDSANTTAPTFSGHTNGMTELAEVGGNNGTAALGLSVSAKTTQQLDTFSVTATCSITLTTTNSAGSFVLAYSAAGAKREANVQFFWGFKVGAGAAGLATGPAAGVAPGYAGRYVETVTGSPAMTADGLQLASTAAAESVATPGLALQTQPQLPASVRRIVLRFDGSLPSTDVDLWTRKASSTEFLVLRYRTASGKLGVQVASGAEQLSDAAVTADTWVGVDLRLWAPSGTSTAFTVDWLIDYGAGPVAQSSLAFTAASGMVGGQPDTLGWAGAVTVPGVTYRYLVCSNVAGHYPLGDYTMLLLGPDPAGTPTVSGSTANFNVFTANGTMAAWNATTARDAVDDWPPTVGASADGFAAVTASATDYVEVPLATYDAAGQGARVQAARVVVPMWAASATAATCRVLGYDGTTATTLFAEADPGADNSSTPAWVCAMWRPTNGWTQAKLDAAAIRFGSGDATPDIGPHSVGMEVAVKPGDTMALFGSLASQSLDAASAGPVTVTVTPPAGQDTTLHYENPSSTNVPVTGGSTVTEVIDAPDAPTVQYLAAYPAAEGEPPS